MKGLLIFGAGGHGRVVADIAVTIGKWDTIAFLDDRQNITEVLGFPIVGSFEDYIMFKDQFSDVFVATGNNSVRQKWIERLMTDGFNLPFLIHPISVVSKFSHIGRGTVVMAGTVINAGTSIGEGCIINTSSSIDHDCVVGDGVHISPGTHVCGTVNIGKNSWVGTGCNIANNINIGSNVVVAAGATVLHDVPNSVMVAGLPAVIKKQLGDE
ncbi:acetyltransferase [Paenibacillus sp. RC67]|uniref:acetyltransferase n=1 Tax=Paenibacillus sp. RC67 TaxID=3039392 RepID=UPI0024ACCB5F|nr:acetyltransferase [Paenibacillus sp. RC67]